MGAKKREGLPRELARARSRFQAWRRRRRHASSHIPDPLWKLAVGLVGKHGISRTASALRLDYYSLKKQVEDAAGQPQSSEAAFIELPAPVVSKQCLFVPDEILIVLFSELTL